VTGDSCELSLSTNISGIVIVDHSVAISEQEVLLSPNGSRAMTMVKRPKSNNNNDAQTNALTDSCRANFCIRMSINDGGGGDLEDRLYRVSASRYPNW
jgi:hypothetical protein